MPPPGWPPPLCSGSLQRFGKPLVIYVSAISIFYMFIYLTAELTSVGGAVALLTGIDEIFSPIIGTAVVTSIYASMGGASPSPPPSPVPHPLPRPLDTDGVVAVVVVAQVCP